MQRGIERGGGIAVLTSVVGLNCAYLWAYGRGEGRGEGERTEGGDLPDAAVFRLRFSSDILSSVSGESKPCWLWLWPCVRRDDEPEPEAWPKPGEIGDVALLEEAELGVEGCGWVFMDMEDDAE